jgi:putative nucleotidyltransferase with HDIG domain
MIQRVKQFFAALTAKISPEDTEFIARHLKVEEAVLFWGMNISDQRHALNVAYTAIDIASGRADIDKTALFKAALLHDVGRTKGDLSIIDKVIAVLLDKYAPLKAHEWGRFGRGGKLDNIRHALFIYYNHPAISASLLKDLDVCDKVVNLVLRHHFEEVPGDPPELNILRKADNLN